MIRSYTPYIIRSQESRREVTVAAENVGWDPLRVELLWDLKEPPARGPKPTLSVDQIVTAAITIADAEGLGALSMQRLASELGVGTMTLYTYIPDKDALLEVMLDRAYGAAINSLTPANGWREYLERVAAALFQAFQAHPWALQVFVGGPPLGPNQMRFLENALAALEGSGLTLGESLDAVMAVTSYVRGTAHISVGIIEHETRTGLTEAQLAVEHFKAYSRVLDPDDFPMTHELLAAPPGESDLPYDFGFEFGLQRLLAGVEQFISSRR
jgi:AcrR family transcriptional regulator